MLEMSVEPFGVRTSFKATTNPLIELTQTEKLTYQKNPKSPFIAEFKNKEKVIWEDAFGNGRSASHTCQIWNEHI